MPIGLHVGNPPYLRGGKFEVVLSPEQLAELARRLRQETPGSPEREAYLDRLAEQIRTGRYQVDTEALARKLAEKLSSEAD